MKLLRPKPSRRVLACLAVLCLAFPAMAYLPRLTIFFAATFDVSGSPGGMSLPAEIGQFGVVSQPAEFMVVPGTGGGSLEIKDNGTTNSAVLEAQFKKLFKGQEVDLEWSIQPSQTNAKLIVSAQDAGDTGLIDCTMDGDGTVDVGGNDTGFIYQPGTAYRMRLSLKAPLAGVGFWVLEIQSDGAVPYIATGLFVPAGDFTMKSLRFTRPANDLPGQFLLDDIGVSTYAVVAGF